MRHLIRSGPAEEGLDWQELALQRLRYLTAAGASFCVIGGILFALRQPNLGVRAGSARPGWLIVVGLVMSLALIWVTSLKKLSPGAKLRLGLIYLVLSCGMAALFRHWLPYALSDVVRGASPTAVMLLFFAVMVPVKPRQMVFTALAVMLIDPLALGVTVWLGRPMPPWNLWLWLMLPNVLVAGLSVITSMQLFRLGKTLQKEREMGSYALEKRLGAGGMGEVWLARHRSLARPAAVKLIRAEALGARDQDHAAGLIQRFVREAKATARLQSPHTIQVFDFGTATDGSFYYVMELLQGMDLDSLLKRTGALPPERVVFLLMQVCHSLEEAHRSGLYHRDIKPANIYVCRQGLELDFVKVLDFGIVKVESQEDTKLTKEGSVMGSPAYLPPEQIQAQRITAQTDVYAIGCVAYCMLTGGLVFTKPNGAAMLVAHLIEAPELPSARLGRALPADLEALVMQCLEKSPEDRPASAAALMEALRATGLVGAWTQADAQAWWEREAPSVLVDSAATTIPPGHDHSAVALQDTDISMHTEGLS